MRRPGPHLLDGLRQRRERHRQRHVFLRIGYGVAGVLVVLGGILLLVLPGPGLLVIALGLAMLALEFAWAERVLERALVRLEQGIDRLQNRRTPSEDHRS